MFTIDESKLEADTSILKRFVKCKGLKDIPMGPLELLAKDEEFKKKVYTMEIALPSSKDEKGWKEIDEVSKTFHEIYGTQAENLHHWQRVIETYENKLKTLASENDLDKSKLIQELDEIVSDLTPS